MLGVPTLVRELPTFARGYLPSLGRYLPWPGGTYTGLGGVPTFFGGVSTLAMKVPSLVGAVLTLTGGTYLSWGYLPLLGGDIYPGQGDVPSLVISENISLWESVMVLKEYFSLGGCAGPVKCQNMSSCQKDVKLSKKCQMSKSQTSGLWRRFTKK